VDGGALRNGDHEESSALDRARADVDREWWFRLLEHRKANVCLIEVAPDERLASGCAVRDPDYDRTATMIREACGCFSQVLEGVGYGPPDGLEVEGLGLEIARDSAREDGVKHLVNFRTAAHGFL